MKSFIAASVAFLASSAVALPKSFTARQDFATVTFAVINDQTGHQASATIPTDGNTYWFSGLFGNSVLASNGQVIATSTQLTAFPQGVNCDLFNPAGQFVVDLTDEKTYFDLDGNPNTAIPVDVSGYSINCTL